MPLRISRDDYRGWVGWLMGRPTQKWVAVSYGKRGSRVSVDTPLLPLPELASVDCSPSTMSHNKSFFPRLLPVRHLILATGKITLMKKGHVAAQCPEGSSP